MAGNNFWFELTYCSHQQRPREFRQGHWIVNFMMVHMSNTDPPSPQLN